MISKETQYRIYAGTRKEDYTGWEKVDVENLDVGDVDFWSLNLGNGYYLDRVTKRIKGLFHTRKVRLNCIRRDNSIEDPDGVYKDVDLNIIYDVQIRVSNDAIKFEAKNNTFLILSRVPIDWDEFSEGVPKFEDPKDEKNYASFYS